MEKVYVYSGKNENEDFQYWSFEKEERPHLAILEVKKTKLPISLNKEDVCMIGEIGCTVDGTHVEVLSIIKQ